MEHSSNESLSIFSVQNENKNLTEDQSLTCHSLSCAQYQVSHDVIIVIELG